MDRGTESCKISDTDLRAALEEMGIYVDITEEDLKKIYSLALSYAEQRQASRVKVGEVMTRTVISVKPDSDIMDAAALLSENRISGLPVVDRENRVVGVISEADILSAAGLEKRHHLKDILLRLLGQPLSKRKRGNSVREVMSSPAITTTADIDLKTVAEILDTQRIKRLPVVDGENRLIGIVSRGDIVKAVSRK